MSSSLVQYQVHYCWCVYEAQAKCWDVYGATWPWSWKATLWAWAWLERWHWRDEMGLFWCLNEGCWKSRIATQSINMNPINVGGNFGLLSFCQPFLVRRHWDDEEVGCPYIRYEFQADSHWFCLETLEEEEEFAWNWLFYYLMTTDPSSDLFKRNWKFPFTSSTFQLRWKLLMTSLMMTMERSKFHESRIMCPKKVTHFVRR